MCYLSVCEERWGTYEEGMTARVREPVACVAEHKAMALEALGTVFVVGNGDVA
jgi:hypothetical protein